MGGIVIGKPQRDNESGLVSDTLHCCGLCRGGCLPDMSQGYTLWTSMLPDENKFQIQMTDELIELHEAAARGEHPAQPPTYHDPGFKKLFLAHDENDYDAILDPAFDPFLSTTHQVVAAEAARIIISGVLRPRPDGRRNANLTEMHRSQLQHQLLAA